MSTKYILAIDQGTSSTKTIIFDNKAQVVARYSEPLKTYYHEGGFVEQAPEEIFANVLASVQGCVDQFKQNGNDTNAIATLGISNQRETFVVWDEDGKPLYNAVVWQCKRSVEVCRELKATGIEEEITAKTGLIIDPYFSGTKLIWLYRNNAEIKQAVDAGKAYFGNIDTWLLYKLTNGKQYFTDYTNASRTLFFNLHTLQWDKELLAKFGLSNINLPELKPSSAYYGETDLNGILNKPISITGMIGDSHAAAFGEGCYSEGIAKATMGTGCSILMNIGNKPKASGNGMVTTICWSTEQETHYAFEGVIVTCGATIEWLKNELGIITDARQTEAMATAVEDNNGVYLVPAFSGLGAPHWDMARKASISGLTFDCNKNHVVRAALESIAYQIKDVVIAMQADSNLQLNELMVHGGMTANKFVLEFLAGQMDCNIVTNNISDISALGAALLAGLKAGIFKGLDEIKALFGEKQVIGSNRYKAKADQYYKGWQECLNSNL
jgi:glycerol kinase